MRALELMEQVLSDYIETLDNDDIHPFVELFYSQIGNMGFELQQLEKA